jgi:hypothetical protein
MHFVPRGENFKDGLTMVAKATQPKTRMHRIISKFVVKNLKGCFFVKQQSRKAINNMDGSKNTFSLESNG